MHLLQLTYYFSVLVCEDSRATFRISSSRLASKTNTHETTTTYTRTQDYNNICTRLTAVCRT